MSLYLTGNYFLLKYQHVINAFQVAGNTVENIFPEGMTYA